MKKVLVIFGMLGFSISTLAALSPAYQSRAEIQAIVDSEELITKLPPHQRIDSIVYHGDTSTYTVSSDGCGLSVRIIYIKNPKSAGAVDFKLEIDETLICR